jgi:hypothetical protein
MKGDVKGAQFDNDTKEISGKSERVIVLYLIILGFTAIIAWSYTWSYMP